MNAERVEPLRVGVTGGIASGKSTVVEMFAAYGVAVIDTDVIAREVVAPGQPALDEIHNEFGPGVFADDGALDRPALRRIVFSDEDARQRLERILHPKIRAATLAQAAAAGGIYQLIVVPLLTTSPLQSYVNRILVVDCDEDTQIRRMMARDTESEGQARRILQAQANRSERLAIADDVISNDGDLNATLAQVQTLHRKYSNLARGR